VLTGETKQTIYSADRLLQNTNPDYRTPESNPSCNKCWLRLRKTIDAGHKNIYRSRDLIKESKITFEESRLIILASRRLTSRVSAGPTGLCSKPMSLSTTWMWLPGAAQTENDLV
jgi:hypothetical protein